MCIAKWFQFYLGVCNDHELRICCTIDIQIKWENRLLTIQTFTYPVYCPIPRLSCVLPYSPLILCIALFPAYPVYCPIPRLSCVLPYSPLILCIALFPAYPVYCPIPRLSCVLPYSPLILCIALFPAYPVYCPIPRLSCVLPYSPLITTPLHSGSACCFFRLFINILKLSIADTYSSEKCVRYKEVSSIWEGGRGGGGR